MNDDTIEVRFMHPKDSKLTLTADISPQCTAQEAIQELMRDADGSGPFLPPLRGEQNYRIAIRRTEQEIASHMTFAQAGAIDGDAIVITEDMIGAVIRPALD